MKVTAKQIAEAMGISTAAVSMALNNKPGVSEKLRRQVISTARSMGYDFTRIDAKRSASKTVGFVFFHKNFVFDTPFFTELATSTELYLKQSGYQLSVCHIHDLDNIDEQVRMLDSCHYAGIILLGTTMSREEFLPFMKLSAPLVLLDTRFPGLNVNSVSIANQDGAFAATDYLISRWQAQPGYLQASQSVANFAQREEGFFGAVRAHSMSVSKSIVHKLSPSLEGACADMLAILKNGEPIARCYFADNDEIALGAIRAFREVGYRIPEDVAIIGFDNLSYSSIAQPPLSTYHIPKGFMGMCAASLLLNVIQNKYKETVNVQINGKLIIRDSA